MHSPASSPRSSRRLTSAASIVVALLAGCGDGTAPPPAPVITKVAVVAPRTTLAIGDTLRLTATASDSAGRTVEMARFTWTVVDASLATVDTGGLMRALRPGMIEVRATAVAPEESVRGSVSGSVAVEARQLIARVQFTAPDTILTGDTVQLTAVAYDGMDAPMPQVNFIWSVSDTTIAAVGTSGVLVGRGLGRATVVVHASGPSEVGQSLPSAEKAVAVRLVLTSLAGGAQHNCGVARGGVVHCWGDGSWGRLGTGVSHDPPARISTPVPVLADARFVSVDGDEQHDARSGHSCGLSATGVAYCWGSGAWGMLGDGKFGQGIPPYVNAVPTPLTGVGPVRQVSIGAQHSCVLAVDGSAHCAGGNSFGQVGVDPATGVCADEPCAVRLVAVQGGHTFVEITAGGYHNCGLTAANEAFCWGSNGLGELGTSTPAVSSSATPQRAGTLQFATVSAGASHTCALDLQGTAYCWGFNYAGQLGIGESRNGVGADTPTGVATVQRFSRIFAGGNHTCALTADGVAYCWGANEKGRLGAATNEMCGDTAPDSFPCATTPQPVNTTLRFVSLALGVQHTCGLTATGRAHCWGGGGNGQLGDGTTADRAAPVAVIDVK